MTSEKNSLTAKVKPIKDYDLLSVTNYFDDLRSDREVYDIDVVSIEMSSGLVDRLEELMEKDDSLKFEDFGNMSLLLNYIKKLDLPLFVGDIYEFEEGKIKEIRDYMENNNHSFVYQMCSFQFQERLETLYGDNGFDVII
tara:strand:+ start:72 stop:491 length:420 start_codon:yes stop_codon:yes gene_type:complete